MGISFRGNTVRIFRGQILCWVRDPVRTTCSHYAYWRRNSRELRDVPEKDKPDILAFAHRPSSRNVQARFLNGTHPNAFDFIGRTEEYERSLELLGRILGISLPAVEIKNQNRTKLTDRYPIEDAVRASIEELNQQDTELVRVAEERFSVLCEQLGFERIVKYLNSIHMCPGPSPSVRVVSCVSCMPKSEKHFLEKRWWVCG